MTAKVITITREFGSGGRTIGRELARRLGYDFYDYELVRKLAEESGLAESYIAEHGEDATVSSSFAFAWSNWGNQASDDLYVAQRNLIRDLAEKGNCVIVGRCADYILQDRTDTFHAYIHADLAYRMNRVVTLYGESDQAIEKRVQTKDKRRIALYTYYTDRKWGRAEYYDLCVNSGRLGIEASVDLLEQAVHCFDLVHKD